MKKLSQFQGLKEGNVQIWYQKDMRELDYWNPEIDTNNLSATHIHLGNIDVDNEEEAFELMQGMFWSPRGEAFDFIQEKGVQHTSMMVNDIVVINGRKLIAKSMGWEEL